jgi:arylsulfatase
VQYFSGCLTSLANRDRSEDSSFSQFAYALSNQPDHKSVVTSEQPLTPGNHILRVKFDYEGGGIGKGATATLLGDEKEVGQVKIPKTIGVRFSLDETFDVGVDTGTPVLEDYAE